MEQKQRENEEYLAKKKAEIAELEKEHEELKARLQELQLKTEEKKAQDLKSENTDMKKMIISYQTRAEESIAALGEQMQVKYVDIGKSLNERMGSFQTDMKRTVETLERALMKKLEGKEDRKPLTIPTSKRPHPEALQPRMKLSRRCRTCLLKYSKSQTSPYKQVLVFCRLPKEMTVVFLEETGVGKSTFINGLVNYLKYATLYEAQQKGVEILIKAYFTLSDSDYKRLEIKCEPTIKVEKSAEVGNEVTKAGQSCTQFPKSYKFVWSYGGEERVIRIIDTPGVGDVRGVGKEKENFHQILSFLADFKKINAICILLRPNEHRFTIGFRYCVNELLSHLHVSAARNILFCFTNARQTLYCPGETLGALESHLATLRKERRIEIPLNKNTMFYFDNEAFRFLCALNKGAKFKAREIENFNESWVRSVEETFRLFGRIAELDAHDAEKTLSVNNIRSVILGMFRPLTEIARNQLQNARLIDDKTNEVARPRLIKDRVQIQNRIDEGKDLTGRLYVDQVKIETQRIDHPITVCAAAKCVELTLLHQVPSMQNTLCQPHGSAPSQLFC